MVASSVRVSDKDDRAMAAHDRALIEQTEAHDAHLLQQWTSKGVIFERHDDIISLTDDEIVFFGRLMTRGDALWAAAMIGHDDLIDHVMTENRIEFPPDRYRDIWPIDFEDLMTDLAQMGHFVAPSAYPSAASLAV